MHRPKRLRCPTAAVTGASRALRRDWLWVTPKKKRPRALSPTRPFAVRAGIPLKVSRSTLPVGDACEGVERSYFGEVNGAGDGAPERWASWKPHVGFAHKQ
jgi:hypothetical protein